MTDKPAKVHVSEVLTPIERKYCVARARGYSKAESYRQAADKPRLKAEDASSRAIKVENRPRVITKLRALLDAANKADLLSHGAYVAGLLSDLEECRAASNWTAASSVQRLLGQAIGSLSDTIEVRTQVDQSVLIEKLRNAGVLDDTALNALSDKLSAKDTFH